MLHKPFHDDGQVLQIGGLTIENGVDGVVIYGELTILPNQSGRTQAQALHEITTQLLRAFDGQIEPSQAPVSQMIDNPFA